MINVSEEARYYLLSDSTTKEIEVNVYAKSRGTAEDTNYYKGDIEEYTEECNSDDIPLLANLFPRTDEWQNYINYTLRDSRRFICISFDLKIANLGSPTIEYLNFQYYFHNKQGQVWYFNFSHAVKVSEYLQEPKRTFFYVESSNIDLDYFSTISLTTDDHATFVGSITVSKIQVDYADEVSDLPKDYAATINNDNLKIESFKYKESLCSQDNIKFGLCESSSVEFSVVNFDDVVLKDATLNIYLTGIGELEEKIPFGKFKVSEVKSQIDHLLTTKTITAYDDIIKLEDNAADWYAQYMFGIDFYGDTGYHGFEFARQIYSTYYDYIVKVGNDSSDHYSQTLISTIANANIVNYLSNKKVKYNDVLNYYIRYAKITISTPTKSRYRVIFNTVGVDWLKVWMTDYYDPLWRGILNANVLIEETRTTGTNRFLVDAGDMFMTSPDCTSFNIYVPYDYYDGDNNVSIKKLITSDITILQVNDDIDLENGYIRLLYYDWNTKEIFESDTSITGRDVVRSLLEPCGCFYRMNRETNIPEFVYCTKGGLYPSETLYPADDLYPRTGTDVQLTVGKYMSFTRGETQVQNFGKIQIRKGGTIKDAESVCEWQYTGDENSLNTYIIEDNIFYCNDKLTYSADMTEVAEMLEKMWLRISNMGYVSNITEALGMPWVQCGDRVGIFTIDGGAETFIFRRTLSGIQLMKDTYESNGDEYNKAISNYNFGG